MTGFHWAHRKVNMFLLNHVFAGTDCWNIKRRLMTGLGYSIGTNTKIVGPIYCSGSLQIGENSWIGRNLKVNGNGEVVIGDNCDIGPDVSFETGGHQIGTHYRRAGKGAHYKQVIGNGVWICANATFVNSITVGDGCVVAASACVTNDVGPDFLVGGVPAKVIRGLSNND